MLNLYTTIIDLALASSLVLIAAFLINLFFHKASAASRSRTWEMAVIALLILPVIYFVVPAFHLNLIDLDQPRDGYSPSEAPQMLTSKERATFSNLDAIESQVSPAASFPLMLPLIIWLAGALILSVWFFAGWLGVALINRNSTVITEAEYLDLLKDVSWELSLNRQIELRESASTAVSITTGTLNPRVILPTVFRKWSEDKLRVVLTHELAHIQRNDALVESLAKVVNVIFWFNPLAWMGINMLRAERERASDDLVLNSGTKPSEYATQLMEVASELGSTPRPLWQMAAISQGSALKHRLLCILDPKLKRNFAKKSVSSALAFSFIILVLLSASCRIWCPQDGKSENANPNNSRHSAGYAPQDNDPAVKGTMKGDHNPNASLNKEFSYPEGPDEKSTGRQTSSGEEYLANLIYEVQCHELPNARKAVLAIVKLDDESCIRGCRIALRSQHKEVARIAATRLANLRHSGAADVLMRQLNHRFPDVAQLAITGLVNMGGDIAFAACRKGFDSDHFNVRHIASNYITGIQTSEAVQLLQDLTDHPKRDVREYAREELLCRNSR